MAKARPSSQESESLVKGYELEVVRKDVEKHEDFIKDFGTKLNSIDEKFDRIIEMLSTRPTTDVVEAMITIAIKTTEERMQLTYGPIVVNNRRLLWAVVTTSLGLIGSLVLLAVGLATR